MPRSAFAAALLLLSLVRGASAADPIPRERLMPLLARELAETRSSVRERLRDDPAAQARAMEFIDGTEKAFRERVGSFGRKPAFPVEVSYLRAAFEGLILWKAAEAARIMMRKDSTLDGRKEELALLNRGDPARRRRFEEAFISAHEPEIEEAVRAHREWRRAERKAGRLAEPEAAETEDLLSDFKQSPLLVMGRASVRAGVAGDEPERAAASAAAPAAKRRARKPRGAAGDEDEEWEGIMGTAASGGAPRSIAGSAANAMLAGRFSEAADLARTALEFDPGSPSALAILNSVKGRADAIDAGASARFAAAASAAALSASAANPGGRPGAAAPSASAQPSAEVAAEAAAGAARVSVEEALSAASVALRLRDATRALALLDKALLEDPQQPRLLHLRSGIRSSRREWREAAADADAGLALAPGNLALLLAKAYAENRARRYEAALEASERALRTEPRNAWALANRAHARAGLGDRAGMIADLETAAALDPRFIPALASASELQLPSDSDVLFLFPGEAAEQPAPAPAAPAAGGRLGLLAAAVSAGLLLLAGAALARRGAPAPTAPAAFAFPPETPAAAGGVIRGQYELGRRIGSGGMGTVYEGSDLALGRRVAIKRLREELRLNARSRERFVLEARTVSLLDHPNIVDIYAIAEEGDDVFLVFEFVEGGTVDDLLGLKGRLEPAEAVRLTCAIGDALSYAHSRGVIHLDMKPSNVMLTADGGIKVMDFGIARSAKDALTRHATAAAGTPPYMAPEQEHGGSRKESDVYALAVCSYEMLTGERPFIGVAAGMLMNKINMSYIPPSRAVAGLPPSLDEVFQKAFQADPERRYSTPDEFSAALTAALDGARLAPAPA